MRDKRDSPPEEHKVQQPPEAHQIMENHISGTSGSFHGGGIKLRLDFLPEVIIVLIVVTTWLFAGTPSLKDALVMHWCAERCVYD